MKRVRLSHWNDAEAGKRSEQLRAAGYQVDTEPLTSPAALRGLKDDPPTAIVIDLSRMPSHGRDVGVALRHNRGTRHIPLVFVEGDPLKVDKIRGILPDAVYTSWSGIRGALKQAISNPPADPVAPGSLFEGYSGTPLPRKLGIRENSVVILAGAPEDFESTLGELPGGVTLRRQARGRCDLIIWFTRSRRDLESRVERMGVLAGRDGLWIAWPKKASGVATDLTQNEVRRIGLASGLVDYKICAIDSTWSGLRFTRRKQEQP